MWLGTSWLLDAGWTSHASLSPANMVCLQSQLASARDWAEVSWAPDSLLSLSSASDMTGTQRPDLATTAVNLGLVTFHHGFQSCGSCFPKRAHAISNQRSDGKQSLSHNFFRLWSHSWTLHQAVRMGDCSWDTVLRLAVLANASEFPAQTETDGKAISQRLPSKEWIICLLIHQDTVTSPLTRTIKHAAGYYSPKEQMKDLGCYLIWSA